MFVHFILKQLTGKWLEEETLEKYEQLLSKMNSTMSSKLSPHAPEFIPRNVVLQVIIHNFIQLFDH